MALLFSTQDIAPMPKKKTNPSFDDTSQPAELSQPSEETAPDVAAAGADRSDSTHAEAGTESRPDSTRHAATFPIVGIGASAGGLEAFERFFKAMPADAGMAFVIVQHLDPTHKSLLTELVRKFTQMPVQEIEDKVAVQSNTVYIIPPNCDLTISKGHLHLLDQSHVRGRRLPIDLFFHSMAADLEERAICIVLSGTGTEGTLGLKAIKERDGMVMVQSPDSAQYDGMPRSAVSTGLADFVLPPERMPEQLIAYVRRAAVPQGVKPTSPPPKPPSEQLTRILTQLRAQTGHDFSLYKQNTIIRRIERRMSVSHIDSLADYAHYLPQNPVEVETLFKELLIEVTNFFRDPDAFTAIRVKVIPALITHRPLDTPVRIWVPGCSTGEEAYSLAMLLRDYMDEHRREYKVQIFATDIDKEAIEVARAGAYTDSISADIPNDSYLRFFSKEGNTYQVRKPIRDMIVFAMQSVVKDPPFSKLDLVSCRNLMIYMGPELQRRVLRLFHYALKPGGYLFLGSSESVGEFSDLFTAVDRKWKIYERRGHMTPFPTGPTYAHEPAPSLPSPATERDLRPRDKVSLRDVAERSLLNTYAPAAVIINDRGDVLYIHGRTGKYLEPSSGEANMNIVAMARDGLRLELGTALRKALVQHEEVRYEHLRVRTNGDAQHINLVVRPLTEPDSVSGLLLVVFEEYTPPEPAETGGVFDAPEAAQRRITELEQELSATREYLRATVEELETTNEELKSVNEELQSANEELQSTNEELETSTEELQSVNEELMTVNVELETNLESLTRANNDLNNLLVSTDIGTIFLDDALCVERFTPAAARFVNLIPGDVGRPIAHLVANLENTTLVEDARAVIDTLKVCERELRTTEGRWCLVRVLPYRTVENVVQGAVISFIDITEQKRTQERLQVLTRAIEQSPSIVMITNLQGEIEYVNSRFTAVTGYTPEDVLGKPPRFLRSDEYAAEFFQQMWDTLLAGKEWHGELHNRKKNGDMFWETVVISPLRLAGGTMTQFVSVGEDVTALKQMEGLRRLAAVIHDSEDAISVLDFDGGILAWNRGATNTYGWTEAEALKLNLRDLIPGSLHSKMLETLHRLKEGHSPEPFRSMRRSRDGKPFEVWCTMSRLLGDNGQAFGISVTERNITGSASQPWDQRKS
ncbi:MAG TPA: chemotaxis protein CheB [bacterium]